MSRLSMTCVALAAVLLCAACTSPGEPEAGSASSTTSAGPTATATATSEPTEEPATEEPAEDPPATVAPVVPDDRQTATVVVTTLSWNAGTAAVEASAYVPVVEDGGRCTLSLVSGTTTVTVESAAFPDAASTSCDLLAVPGSQLRSGPWQATLSYLSVATRASAEPLTIEVP